nr:hypothetical protein HK105_001025 [Polyrhizophydium stewartii]
MPQQQRRLSHEGNAVFSELRGVPPPLTSPLSLPPASPLGTNRPRQPEAPSAPTPKRLRSAASALAVYTGVAPHQDTSSPDASAGSSAASAAEAARAAEPSRTPLPAMSIAAITAYDAASHPAPRTSTTAPPMHQWLPAGPAEPALANAFPSTTMAPPDARASGRLLPDARIGATAHPTSALAPAPQHHPTPSASQHRPSRIAWLDLRSTPGFQKRLPMPAHVFMPVPDPETDPDLQSLIRAYASAQALAGNDVLRSGPVTMRAPFLLTTEAVLPPKHIMAGHGPSAAMHPGSKGLGSAAAPALAAESASAQTSTDTFTAAMLVRANAANRDPAGTILGTTHSGHLVTSFRFTPAVPGAVPVDCVFKPSFVYDNNIENETRVLAYTNSRPQLAGSVVVRMLFSGFSTALPPMARRRSRNVELCRVLILERHGSVRIPLSSVTPGPRAITVNPPASWSAAACSAVRAAYHTLWQEGVLHVSVAERNVLFAHTDDASVRLCDFEQAKLRSDMHPTEWEHAVAHERMLVSDMLMRASGAAAAR